jgi:hypothetical protein
MINQRRSTYPDREPVQTTGATSDPASDAGQGERGPGRHCPGAARAQMPMVPLPRALAAGDVLGRRAVRERDWSEPERDSLLQRDRAPAATIRPLFRHQQLTSPSSSNQGSTAAGRRLGKAQPAAMQELYRYPDGRGNASNSQNGTVSRRGRVTSTLI